MAFLSSNGRPIKPDVTGSSLGFRPIAVPRPAGMSNGDYRDYQQRVQGEQARQEANRRGVDTSGMKWDGEKFVDANEVHRYADPGFWGPVAVTAATMGAGLLPNAAAQAPTTASTLAGPGASALAPGATSAAVPGATSAALNTSPYYLGALGPAATSGLTAAQIAAAAAPTALSVGPYVSNLFRPDAPSTAQPSSSGPGSDTGSDTINSPGYPGTPSNSTTNSPGLPFGLRANDLAGYGLNFLNNFLNRNAANDQGEARAAADKAALDFAIRAYDEQKALEQARWDANETRRVPYRRASLDTLAEFRKLLGLGD